MFALPRNIILTKSSYFVNSLSLLNCSPGFINSIGALNFYNSFCSTEKEKIAAIICTVELLCYKEEWE